MNVENNHGAEQAEERASGPDHAIGDAVDQHGVNPAAGSEAKWAAVVNDRPFPLPRRRLRARDILAQAGERVGMLVRDLNQPQDVPIAAEAEVDLAEGNVFRVISECESPAVDPMQHGTAKLAFFMDDAWEVTVQSNQTLESLRGLFDLPDDTEIVRDFTSLHDEQIFANSVVRFKDGPVFLSRITSIVIKVNNRPVRFTKRRVTGLEIKQTAIAQEVPIDLECVLYRVSPAGDLGPAIRDDQHVLLKKCDQFRCIAPDDNSQDAS